MNEQDRRITDLIDQAADPVVRATLIVLQRLVVDLDSNTRATERIADAFEIHRSDFTAHVLQEEKLIASVKGSIRTTLALGFVIVAVVQGIAGVFMLGESRERAAVEQKNAYQDERLALFESRQLSVLQRLSAIEAALAAHSRDNVRNGDATK